MAKVELKIKIKPLGDRIVVERIEEEEVKKGGIIIPDTARIRRDNAAKLSSGGKDFPHT